MTDTASTTSHDPAPLWTYDRFGAGQVFGTVDIALDARRRADFEAIFGPVAGAQAPRALVLAAMMDAYLLAIVPRPAGNVHARQTLEFTGPAPAFDAVLQITLSCRDKEIRRDRRFVHFEATVTHAGAPVCRGIITSIWAE